MDEPLLALDGALGCFSAAVLARGAIFAKQLDGRDALERGIGLLEEVVAEAGFDLPAIASIAVGTGPGGFTGLRIAIAFAKSLALGLQRPITGVSSFDILDAAAQAQDLTPRLTIVQGRVGTVCIRRTGGEGAIVACGPVEPTLARVLRDDSRLTLVGATEDVHAAVRERGTSVHMASPTGEPPAATLARIARTRPAAASVHAIAPDYGEIPAARIPS